MWPAGTADAPLPSECTPQGRSVAAGDPLLEVRGLLADLRAVAVTGVDQCLGGQRQDPVANRGDDRREVRVRPPRRPRARSEEHTSELQSRFDLVCRLLLE